MQTYHANIHLIYMWMLSIVKISLIRHHVTGCSYTGAVNKRSYTPDLILVGQQSARFWHQICLFQLSGSEWILIHLFILEIHKISKFHANFSIHKGTINRVNFRILTKVSRRKQRTLSFCQKFCIQFPQMLKLFSELF